MTSEWERALARDAEAAANAGTGCDTCALPCVKGAIDFVLANYTRYQAAVRISEGALVFPAPMRPL